MGTLKYESALGLPLQYIILIGAGGGEHRHILSLFPSVNSQTTMARKLCNFQKPPTVGLKCRSLSFLVCRDPGHHHHRHLHRVQAQVSRERPRHEAHAEPDGHARGQGGQGVQGRYASVVAISVCLHVNRKGPLCLETPWLFSAVTTFIPQIFPVTMQMPFQKNQQFISVKK